MKNVCAEHKIGIDISIEMIKLNSRQASGAIYILGRFPDIPIQDDLTDLLHASFILDHVTDVHKVLVKASRILRCNGQFILVEFNPESMLRYRGGEKMLKWKSTTGKIYEVQSDFNHLADLTSLLRRHFKIDGASTTEIGVGGIKINYYKLRKK